MICGEMSCGIEEYVGVRDEDGRVAKGSVLRFRGGVDGRGRLRSGIDGG